MRHGETIVRGIRLILTREQAIRRAEERMIRDAIRRQTVVYDRQGRPKKRTD